MSTIALAGDWHGNARWAVARIADVAERGVDLILHLGDFGIWPGESGLAYVRQVEEACAERGVETRQPRGLGQAHPALGRCSKRGSAAKRQ